MFRSIIIPVILGVLALFSFISSQVTLDVNMPESAKAGDEFVIEITINKGDIEGFARFQQELPVGFTAVARQSANGEFKFEDQKVKIQWMQVPSDRAVIISYAIQVAPTVSGNFSFEGKFSYIENNTVQTISSAPKSVLIIGDETAAGTAEQAQTTYSYQNVSLKNIDCVRQKPFLNENNEVIVNLMINKGELKEFGKIQEQIPRGYRAESIKSKNSIFTFKNSIIKFLWMNMPPEAQFVVSYKLIPEGEISNQAFLISGTFSYAENERTKTINIGERAVDLSTFAGEDLVAQTVTPAANNQNTVVEQPQETKPLQTETYTDQSNTATQIANTETTDANPNLYDVEQKEAKQKETKTAKYMNNLAAITTIPLPENGVSYRVQIAAGHKLVGKNYFKRLNITDDVQVEIHDGWNKYTVGNFGIYRDARDYRIYVWNNTPIQDAFVAAYNSGMRITVQEALMIANQKWYE
ncbi:MAG: hypothetical protein WCX31_16115 [Salinivirgaceae bacterium]